MIRIVLNRLLLFFLLVSGAVSAQRSSYYIKNYDPKDYGGYNQMWQATQDKNGLIYFAGTSCIYTFDGTAFQSTLVKAGSANRQVLIDTATGIIYVGAVGEFGYLQRDSVNGKILFKSLKGSLTEEQKVFADIWKIYISNGKVYFQSSERIFICQDKKIVGTIEASHDKGFALMFQSNGRLFVRQRTVGLMEIINDKLQLCPGGERFAGMRLLGMIPWKDGKSLVLSGDSGFYVMDPKRTPGLPTWFSTFAAIPDTFLVNHGPLGCKWVNDSTFAVYTRSGVGFFNRDAKLIEYLNKTSGLGDESIADVFVDRQKNIWLMHNNGMSKVCYNTPALFFADESGFTGTIQCMIRYHGKFLVATTEGLFAQSSDTNSSPSAMHLKRVMEIPHTEIWSLFVLNDALFISTSEGAYYWHDNKIEMISDHFVNRICATPNPDEFVAVEKGGISFYSFSAGHPPKMVRHYEMPGEDIIGVGKVKNPNGEKGKYDFWCTNRFKEVIHAHFDISDTNFVLQYYDTSNGIPLERIYLIELGDSTYFFSGLNAYRYVASLDKNPASKCLVSAPEIFEKIVDGNYQGLQLPFDFSLFLQKSRDPLTTFYGVNAENKLFRTRLPLAYCFGGTELQYIYCENNGISWLASGSIIMRYDTKIKPPSNIPFNTVISRVLIGKDSSIFFGSDNINFVKEDAIPYKFNSIAFKFSAVYFEFDGETDYFYKLDGFDTTWYPIKTNPEKSYMNLPEGTYTFKVKMINLHGRASNEASYTFTILAPWYRTGIAYFLYVLGFIFTILISVRLAVRRIRLQKEKLEIIVKERTAEVVEQKQQIEIQNEELAIAYQGMRDSIHYAQRIQDAILPVQSSIRESFPDSFVFFRPRDIVSGDFYWFSRRENKSFVACVDCTGHGVPGAFMSMIGNTLLNEIVLEKNIEDADKILDLLHIRVRQALHQDSGGATRDGMDIALCVMDHSKNKLQYAGANRSLWMIRENALTEIKANKFSIAGDQMEENRKFTLHELDLKDEDCIYLSSDGYADQFGGPRGKKLMVKKFQEALLEIHTLPMEQQGVRLENIFNEWKGNLEQVDDVLVIGFRIKI